MFEVGLIQLITCIYGQFKRKKQNELQTTSVFSVLPEIYYINEYYDNKVK